jgi:hypothetical protein
MSYHSWREFKIVSKNNGKPIQVYPTKEQREMIECCADDEERSLSNMLLFAFKRYQQDIKLNGGD